MVANSTHPLSQLIGRQLADIQEDDLVSFEELGGKGLRGTTASGRYRLGSANWLEVGAATTINKTRVYLERDGLVIGYFEVGHRYRHGLSELLSQLSSRYKLIILSGDSDGEKDHLASIFPKGSQFHFNQKPEDKLHFIEGLQARGRKVLMLGDGLNDAGALQQSDVGIAVTDDTSAFTPACDAILHGGSLVRLAAYITFAHRSRHLIYKNFTISFLYNGVGLSMALAGMLTPIFAAILMPLSSISVVLFSTISGNLLAGKMRL